MLIFSAILWVAAAALAYFAWYQARLAGADVKSSCVVVARHTEVRTANDNTNVSVPTVTIAHQVGGQRYERKDEGPEGHDYSSIGNALEGSTIDCWYVRGRPDLVIAFRDRPSGGWPLFAAFMMVLMGVGFLLFGQRKTK